MTGRDDTKPDDRKEIAMRFLERMALVVKADAHGVVDQLEERSLL